MPVRPSHARGATQRRY